MNKLINIQNIVEEQLKTIGETSVNNEFIKNELEKGANIANLAQTYIKTINLNFKLIEYADKNEKNIDELNEMLGIKNERI